tara:strand:+ start:495 stop:902 length:408 start_codon:yes stop_codon:yes gene_type:complete
MSEKEENFNFEKPSDLFNALESYFTRKQPKEAEHRHVLNCPDGTCEKQIGELVKNVKEQPSYNPEGIIDHAKACPTCRTKIGDYALKDLGMVPRNAVMEAMVQARKNGGVDALDAWLQKVSTGKTTVSQKTAGFT